jgi:oxygen-dependent protoporphyrinogen oxidase
MRTIKVVGAGFSGLVTAYYLVKQGLGVRIFESSSRVGGMLQTIHTEHGPVETAANGIRNSARLEALCADVGVPLQPTGRNGRARFIYRGRPRRWPLNLPDVLRLLFGMAASARNWRPRPFETIEAWGQRVIGARATEYFLAPALGGIYAGDPKRLSASLIFRCASLPHDLQVVRPSRAKQRGTVAPREGMQQLVDGLSDYLKQAGVEFNLGQRAQAEPGEPTVLCTHARAASEYLSEIAPELSGHLRSVEMLPLVTATCFYRHEAERLKGFGCLFPRGEGFRALGVLFNTWIFEGRGPAHSETWIFGGALAPDVLKLNDEELHGLIALERRRLYGQQDGPLSVHLTRWSQALPHYSTELEHVLTTFPSVPSEVALVGNYLGRIGLSGILERAAHVAKGFAKSV